MGVSLEAVLKSYKKSVKHNMDAGQLDHSFSGLRQELIVDGQSAKVLQPGESSFDNPSSGKDLEFAGAFVRAKHDFDDPAELPEHPVTKGALVSAVGKYLSQARELVLELLDNLRRAFAVMQVGLVHSHGHRNAKCVNHNVLLASLDSFVAVDPSI